MSGAFHFHPFEPDALSDDSMESRATFVLSELERQWDVFVDEAISETRSLAQRFDHYEHQLAQAKKNRYKTHFNPIGELQGCTYRFDALAKAIRDVEDSIDGIRNILYPAEKKVVRSSGAASSKRRKAAGRSKA